MFETQVIGNLGQDATIKDFNGKQYISFSLGQTEKYTGNDGVVHEKTVWISCLKLTKPESKLAQFLKTGTQVYVRGRISTKVYSKGEGENKTYNAGLNLNVYDLELLGGGKRNDQQQAGQQPATHQPPQQSAQTQQPRAQYPGNPAPQQQMSMMPENDDDLPF